MKKRIILLTAVIIFIAGMTRAQWTTDLGKNTQITPTGLAFDENEVATNKDGVTYVFFITNMNGTLGSACGFTLSQKPSGSASTSYTRRVSTPRSGSKKQSA